ncbi:phosphomevalonate kinase [Vanrija albida]|uniref:Phosphomevalonate kinase n=1 Tax=Vanrija albida TaxID=181172 RepID=A0ABR3Q0L8_9TREE
MSSTSAHTIVSAPGKVLLAGGYLVLDRAYTGLVVGTSSRFFCSVVDSPAAPGSFYAARISVRAGQFPSDASTWTYDVLVPAGSRAPLLTPTGSAGRNKFVEATLAKVLQYALERLVASGSGQAAAGAELLRRLSGGGRSALDVVVLADNDFYSQREQLAAASLPARLSSLASLTPFCPLPRGIGQTNKTGLGSSAALVTSLVAGVLSHLGLVDLASAQDVHRIHALAQAAHCFAQGKVGSGFDVSSAVYGSHVYRRFSPAVLEPLFNAPEGAAPSVLACVESKAWDQEVTPFRLPRGLRLLLADVDAGTDTPSFVGKVLAWRKEKPEESLALWTKLDDDNRLLETQLSKLAEIDQTKEYAETLRAFASASLNHLDDQNPIAAQLQQINATVDRIRSGMRDMSTASGVPIEPKEQTRLLDACSGCQGVLGGGVPGAGGYDAIWVLCVDDPAVITTVEDVWASWTEMSVSPLSARQSDGGLQRESAGQVRGLAAALFRAREEGAL